jgi:hypothetical protein
LKPDIISNVSLPTSCPEVPANLYGLYIETGGNIAMQETQISDFYVVEAGICLKCNYFKYESRVEFAQTRKTTKNTKNENNEKTGFRVFLVKSLPKKKKTRQTSFS